MRNKEQWWK